MKTETNEIVQKLDKSVLAVIGNSAMMGFEKAHVVSNAIVELKALLTDEYMKPIMALQGNKLGFRTDKDKNGGYGIEVVRNCLIEAVLMGLQPTGNQFNIIAGNTYPTKEGCGALLNRKDFFPGLEKTIIVGLPRINGEKTSAAFDVLIQWEYNGVKKEKTVPIPIKIDQYASVDSMVGKATRKARAWLLSELTGMEITDGDATENATYKDVSNEVSIEDLQLQFDTKKNLLAPSEYKRIEEIIKNKESQSYKKANDILSNY